MRFYNDVMHDLSHQAVPMGGLELGVEHGTEQALLHLGEFLGNTAFAESIAVVPFGSRLKGYATNYSDLDLFMVCLDEDGMAADKALELRFSLGSYMLEKTNIKTVNGREAVFDQGLFTSLVEPDSQTLTVDAANALHAIDMGYPAVVGEKFNAFIEELPDPANFVDADSFNMRFVMPGYRYPYRLAQLVLECSHRSKLWRDGEINWAEVGSLKPFLAGSFSSADRETLSSDEASKLFLLRWMEGFEAALESRAFKFCI